MRAASEVLWIEQAVLAQVPTGEWPNVYVLGVPASRITFADQQKRAFNLVAALAASGRIRAGDSLAVVGGGVAGITAAAYSAQLGLKPTVFDQHGEAMAIQQGSGRWIHPNLYDWPWPQWDVQSTDFPCMNWNAQTAGEVVASLRREWTLLVDAAAVAWQPNTPVTTMARVGDVWTLNNDDKRHFRAIILAVGFGEEQENLSVDSKAYWRDDDLHQRARGAASILVSGCGDGGLIDTLRALVLDFNYHNLVFEVGQLAVSTGAAEEIKVIEADRPRFPDGEPLMRAYRTLSVPRAVDSALEKTLRRGTRVTLNANAPAPFNRGSSALNRFLISRLMHLGRVGYLAGPLKTVHKKGSTFVARIGADEHTFDHVVVRHGPRPRAIEQFGLISESLAPTRVFFETYKDVADRTRQPLWDDILAQARRAALDPQPFGPTTALRAGAPEPLLLQTVQPKLIVTGDGIRRLKAHLGRQWFYVLIIFAAGLALGLPTMVAWSSSIGLMILLAGLVCSGAWAVAHWVRWTDLNEFAAKQQVASALDLPGLDQSALHVLLEHCKDFEAFKNRQGGG